MTPAPKRRWFRFSLRSENGKSTPTALQWWATFLVILLAGVAAIVAAIWLLDQLWGLAAIFAANWLDG